MAKRKLTDKLKSFLYSNRWRVRQEDYAGEALDYLLRLRRASKAAKKRKANTARIGKTTIPRNSEIYEIIAKSAAAKGMPVDKFIRKYKDAIDELMVEERIPIFRETSYAISDIEKLPKRSKIFINGEKVGKGDAIYAIQSLTSSAMQHTDTVIINYELSYDLNGNLYLTLPTEAEITDAEEMAEEGDVDYYYDMLEDSEGLVPIKSNGKGKK